MLHYILQTVAFQVVFLLIYDVFLKRETFFNYNRIYLLGTAVLSFLLPFIKLESIQAVAPKDFVVVLPEVIIGNLNPPTDLERQIALQTGIELNEPSQPIWRIIFFAGIALATLIFLFKLAKVLWLKYSNPRRWQGNVLIVRLINCASAFSFFNTIFIGENISNQEKPTILKHELVHVKQFHSIDLMLFEVMRILLWFNPLIYMYQNRVKALHEFIADETAVKQSGKKSYYQQLLNQVFETQNVSFTNTFFNKSLIKKRIVMLQKSKSKQRALLKYVLLIPVVFGMLIYTSAEVKAQEKEKSTKEKVEVLEVQEISEKALVEKYYKQMKAIEKTDGISKVMNLINFDINKFRMSLDEFARFRALNKAMFIDKIEKKVQQGTASQRDKEALLKLRDDNKSYAEYLEWQKTEEAKRDWESITNGSTLRLFVNDLDIMNQAEKDRYEEKMALIKKDNYLSSLFITDGKNSKVIESLKAKVVQKNTSDDVEIIEIQESIEVPYSVIENPPTFKECQGLADNSEKKNCTSQNVAKFVNKNFNTDLATELGLSGRQRISVFFKIDKEGNVRSIGARAPHPELEKEAKRVISLLPKFIPGTQRGKAVTVPYSLPIVFQVNRESDSNKTNTPVYDEFSKKLTQEGVPFTKVDKAPVFEECKNLSSEAEKRTCTSKTVSMFVNKNFNLDMATKLGLKGRQKISALLTFSKTGTIKDILVRGPHPALEKETKRVLEMIPTFIPGEHEGKKVDVLYSLPILFQIQE